MNTPAQATPSNFALFAQRYPQLERVSIVARGMSSKGFRKIRRRWWAVRARLHTRESVPYQEAGHVVVAYEFGWWVRRGGVRLGAWAHARLRHRKSDYTVLGESDKMMVATICIRMAGFLAEEKFHGIRWHFEEEVVDHVRAVRAGESEGAYVDPSDLRAIALALLDDDPTISFAGARRVVAYCRDVTNGLFDDPRVWGGVERLAKLLHRRGYLSPRAVKKVLGDAFFADAGRMIRDSHGHPLAAKGDCPKRTTSGAEVQEWRLYGPSTCRARPSRNGAKKPCPRERPRRAHRLGC